MSTFLEIFFAFVAGGVTLWGLLELRRYLDRRAGRSERSEREWLKSHGVQLQQAAARLSKPHVGPPPTQVPPPTTDWGKWPAPPPPSTGPWPYGGKHEETSAIPQAKPPGDMKGY